MKIEVTVPIVNDEKVFCKSLEISKYNNLMSSWKHENSYVDNLRVDILMVYDEGKYESFKGWYKLRKPKYIESNKTLIIETFLKNGELDMYVNANETESFKMLNNLVLKALEDNELPKKIRSLDKECINVDMEKFSKEQGIQEGLGDQPAQQKRPKNRQKPGRKL